MSTLTILIIFAIVAYTLFEVFASRAADKIDANVSASIFNGLGAVIPIVSYIVYRFLKKGEVLPATSSGWIFSILAGLSIAVFSVLLIKVFEKGGLAYVMPLIYGGTVGLTSLIGILFFHETVSPVQIGGIGLVLAGIGMVIFSKL